jgi:hypothetical protein
MYHALCRDPSARLALAHTLLHSIQHFAPDLRLLHVYARRPSTDYAKILVGANAFGADLKDAVCAKLLLGVAPDCMNLLLEVEGGGVPALLDTCRRLAEQGVAEGARVLVEVQAAHSQPQHQLLTLGSDPWALPLQEYQGLRRSSNLTTFSRAASAAQPGPLCAASGTRMWHLSHPEDPSMPLLWPFLEAQVLVEREFYSRYLCEDQWLGSLAGARQRKCTVLGQPGNGKSAFGTWLLAHLLRSGRTVVYTRNFSRPGSALDLQHYVFHRGAAFQTATADLGPAHSLLQEPTVVHLCDGIKPQSGGRCHKVLITSSDDSAVWRWFVLKEYAGTAYFPLFSPEETEALCQAEFGSALLPPSAVALRMCAYGPCPRTIVSPNQREVAEDVQLAMQDRSLEELQQAMSRVSAPTGGAASDMPHALFVLQADRQTLRAGGVAFRSEAVARRVARLVAMRSRDALIPALQRLLASSATRTVAGTAFELAVTDVLGRGGGGEYPVRQLLGRGVPAPAASNQAPWQVLPATSAMRRFGSLAELAQKCASGEWDLRSQYFKPTSPNLAAIDFIGPGLQLYQVTVNRASHELRVTSGRSEGEGLAALCRTLLPLLPERWGAQQPHLNVCFVVPEGCGEGWKAQKLVVHRKEGSAAAGKVHAAEVEAAGGAFTLDGDTVVQVRQYLMEVPQTVFEAWLQLAEQPRDAIDEAAESKGPGVA